MNALYRLLSASFLITISCIFKPLANSKTCMKKWSELNAKFIISHRCHVIAIILQFIVSYHLRSYNLNLLILDIKVSLILIWKYHRFQSPKFLHSHWEQFFFLNFWWSFPLAKLECPKPSWALTLAPTIFVRQSTVMDMCKLSRIVQVHYLVKITLFCNRDQKNVVSMYIYAMHMPFAAIK